MSETHPSATPSEFGKRYGLLARHTDDRCEFFASVSSPTGSRVPILHMTGVDCAVRTPGMGHLREEATGVQWEQVVNAIDRFRRPAPATPAAEPFPGFENPNQPLQPSVVEGHIIYTAARLGNMRNHAPTMFAVLGEAMLQVPVAELSSGVPLTAEDLPTGEEFAIPSIGMLKLGGDLPARLPIHHDK